MPFFVRNQKIQDKNLKILRTKTAIRMKQKAFFIIFKRLLLEQIKQFFFEGEDPTLNVCITTSLTY